MHLSQKKRKKNLVATMSASFATSTEKLGKAIQATEAVQKVRGPPSLLLSSVLRATV
jgi:hypothetical protein